MKFTLEKGRYKSIRQFEWNDVPMFSVITGQNGSGKTQLLELIASGAGLPPQFPETKIIESERPQFSFSEPVGPRNTLFIDNKWELSRVSSVNLEKIYVMASQFRHERFSRGNWYTYFSELEQKLGKARSNISDDELDEHLTPDFVVMGNSGVDQNSLPELFMSYKAEGIRRLQGGVPIEQVWQQPPPWDEFNKVLDASGLGYRIVPPDLSPMRKLEGPKNSQYALTLRYVKTGDTIENVDLSSGERMIFQVALWSFFFSRNGVQNQTRLLLLDEPDAHLHPAMTQTFLRVMKSELVERHNVRVIMTTHSPSTAALVDRSNLFTMFRNDSTVRPVESKWEAVTRLTSGVVTIGAQTKAVFVEDTDDASFFAGIQQRLIAPKRICPPIDNQRTMHFISASLGKGGGKNMVRAWVEKVETTQIAGIVDGDSGNQPADRLFVLQRYSLESYLFDPLFLYAIMLGGDSPQLPAIDGISLLRTDAEKLISQTEQVLQSVVDAMLKKIRALVKDETTFDGRTPVAYFGDRTVILDDWFLKMPLKSLFDPVRKLFELHESKAELIKKYFDLELIPMEIVDILQRIQNQ